MEGASAGSLITGVIQRVTKLKSGVSLIGVTGSTRSTFCVPRSGPTPKFVSFSFMMLYRGVSGFCACCALLVADAVDGAGVAATDGAASGVGAGFFFFLAATLCAFACAGCAEDDVSSVNCAEDGVAMATIAAAPKDAATHRLFRNESSNMSPPKCDPTLFFSRDPRRSGN